MGKKAKGGFIDLPEVDDEPEQDAAAPPAAQQTGKVKTKGGKGKKGKKGADGFDSEEEDAALKQVGGGSVDDGEPQANLGKGSKKKGGGKKSTFDMLKEDEDSNPAKGPMKLVVAEVIEVSPHPEAASTLRVCVIDDGTDEHTVVTNVLSVEEGMKVVFAPVGCTTPGSGMVITERTLKGVESNGMLCSAFDIGWSKEADGVLVVLPEDDFYAGDKVPPKAPKAAKGGGGGGGKKGKPAFMDLDEEEAGELKAPTKKEKGGKKGKKGGKKGKGAASKKNKKKGGKKGKAAAFDSDDEDMDPVEAPADEEEEEEEEEEEKVAAAKVSKKNKKKGGKKGKAAAFDSDDEDMDTVAAPDEEEEEEEEEEKVAPAKASKKNKKKGGQKGKAAAFDSDDEDMDPVAAPADEEEEEEEEEKVAAAKASKKNKKKGGAKSAALFAALGGSDDEAEEPVDEEKEEEEVVPSPKKKDKKKGGAALFAALEEGGDDVAEEQEEEVVVLPRKDKKKKSGSKAASLFAALEADGDTPMEAAEEDQGEEEAPKKKKKDKGSKSAALFAALGEEGEEGEEAPAAEEEVSKKKKKKSKGADIDSMLSAIADGEGKVEEEPAAPGEKKKKKKSTKDLESMLEAVSLEDAVAAAPAPEAKPTGKKGKAKVKDEDLELAAMLASLDAPKAAPAPKEGKKKKKKGKGGDAGGADEDIDALLAQIDGPAPPTAAADAPAETPREVAPPPNEEAKEDEGSDGDDEPTEGKELTAAQKKKLKKKQKDKEKKSSECIVVDGPKESAAVRRLRETLEAGRAAEEAAQKAHAEAARAEEEEIARLEEEERVKNEDREKKKAAQKARRDQLKKEGKLLTGKAKVEADKLAVMRAQLLAQAVDKGLNLDTAPSGDVDAADKKPKKVVYGKKQTQKKKQTPAAEDSVPLADLEPAAPALSDEPSATELSLPPAAAAAAEVVPAPVPEPVPEEESEGDSEEDSDGDSDEDSDDDEEDSSDEEEEEESSEEESDEESDEDSSNEDDSDDDSSEYSMDTDDEKEARIEEARDSNEDDSSEYSMDTDDEKEARIEEARDFSDEDDSDEDDSEYSMDTDDEKEARIEEARDKRLARSAAARKNADPSLLRSPICCVLGHVDVGKTKILDNIRRTNVQDGEAGGITQQIGATFVPRESIIKRTETLRKGKDFDLKLPGLLIIDTPGHESFTNLRQRGSGLCDMAVLIVDLMHGLEPQTIESIGLLKSRKTPFVIALNKVDRMYGWNSVADSPIRDAFDRQPDYVHKEFETRSSDIFLQLNEQGLNVALYWKNTDPRKYVSIVPTSAISGEGIPDLVQIMAKLTQTMMQDKLMYVADTQCTVLECHFTALLNATPLPLALFGLQVKTMEGLGTTVDCVLVNGKLKEGDRIVVCGLGGPIVSRVKALKTPMVNGKLKEGDRIVVCGLGGPIVSRVKALKTPMPLKEIRVKGQMQDHKEIRAAMGVRVVAPGLEQAVAGTSLFVIGPEDDEEELKDSVMEDMADIFGKIDKGGEGVCVQASTLGSLEALLTFLDSDAVGIPVVGINIGPIHKKDVLRAGAMAERGLKKFAVILAFDVPVGRDARDLAEEMGVKIFTADIIYHLFDQFTTMKIEEQEAARLTAVFPCTLKILPTCIFNKKDPIVLGVEVVEGIAKVGTPVCIPTQGGIDLGRIASMELNHKSVDTAKVGQSVAMKIESQNGEQGSRLYGRHFDFNDPIVSRITRESINALKEHFADEMTKDDWRLGLVRFKESNRDENTKEAATKIAEGTAQVAKEADEMMGSFEDELGGIGLPAISDAGLIEDLFDIPEEVQAELHGVQQKFSSLPKLGEDLVPPSSGYPAVGALLLFTSTYFMVASVAAMFAPSWLATYTFNLDPGAALAVSDEILLRVAGASLIPAVACMAMQRELINHDAENSAAGRQLSWAMLLSSFLSIETLIQDAALRAGNPWIIGALGVAWALPLLAAMRLLVGKTPGLGAAGTTLRNILRADLALIQPQNVSAAIYSILGFLVTEVMLRPVSQLIISISSPITDSKGVDDSPRSLLFTSPRSLITGKHHWAPDHRWDNIVILYTAVMPGSETYSDAVYSISGSLITE
eukprot:gene31196-6343_t